MYSFPKSPCPPLSQRDDCLRNRRLKDAGLPPIFSPHGFRFLAVPGFLSQAASLQTVRQPAASQPQDLPAAMTAASPAISSRGFFVG